MKKFILCMCTVLLMGFSYTANAQVSIRININHQPAWGPSGYDRADFYYFPDLNIYYDVNSSMFYYLSGSRWASNRYLPNRYSRYDFYKMHKVVMNNGPRPWLRNRDHRREYMRFRGDRSQTPIRLSNNRRYDQSKRNSRMWVNGNQRNDQRQQGVRPDQRQGPRNNQRQQGIRPDQRQGPRNNQRQQGARPDQRQGPRNNQRQQGARPDQRQGQRNNPQFNKQRNQQPNNRQSDNKHPDNRPGENRGR